MIFWWYFVKYDGSFFVDDLEVVIRFFFVIAVRYDLRRSVPSICAQAGGKFSFILSVSFWFKFQTKG